MNRSKEFKDLQHGINYGRGYEAAIKEHNSYLPAGRRMFVVRGKNTGDIYFASIRSRTTRCRLGKVTNIYNLWIWKQGYTHKNPATTDQFRFIYSPELITILKAFAGASDES